jgi:hypothetical protein
MLIEFLPIKQQSQNRNGSLLLPPNNTVNFDTIHQGIFLHLTTHKTNHHSMNPIKAKFKEKGISPILIAIERKKKSNTINKHALNLIQLFC